MNIYYNTSFVGHYPVGTSAVVIAEDEEEAAKMLNSELVKHGLGESAKAKHFVRIPFENGVVRVLNDGDY